MKQSSSVAAFADALSDRRVTRVDWLGILALTLALLIVGTAAALGPTWRVGVDSEGIMVGLAIGLATWLCLRAARGWDTRTAELARVRASVAFEQLVEHLPLVVYVDDTSDSSSALYTSPQVEGLLGYTPEEWVSDPELFVKVLHPDDRERVLTLVHETNQTGAKFSCEYRMLHRDGRVVWVLDESAHVGREDGRPTSAQGFMLDITRRREAEEQLLRLAWTDELTGLPQPGSADVRARPGVVAGRHGRTRVPRPRRLHLVLHYQPTFDLRTGRIEAVEALLRWQHPTRGLLQPGEFIGHAESTGAINRIGRWALETATAQLAQWQSELGAPPRVAVNLSTVQLRSPALLAEISGLLLKSKLPPEALRLELTESAVLRSDDSSRAVLRALAELGVQLALDDFGKGYSSVGYLENLPFSILKIDKGFLDNAKPGESPLLRGIIGLAKAMELIVVAEGIERQDQLSTVHRLRCEIGQGFYLARPAPPETISELLASDRAPRRFSLLHSVD